LTGVDEDSAVHVMLAFGTRPEAIKMAPLVRALKDHGSFGVTVVVTAQHRGLLDQALEVFGITPDDDLDIMQSAQGLPDLTSRILLGMDPVIAARRPDILLVHGDTTTTLACALAAFYAKVPVGHVEAGLRTGDMRAPWPEEMNRRLTTSLSDLHFAPTQAARQNLLREGVPDARIHVTGNTVIDALLLVARRLQGDAALRQSIARRFPWLDPERRLVLVTGHRRENLGTRFEAVFDALARLARRPDLQIVYTVHPNPAVSGPARERLSGCPNLVLIEPQEYLPFVFLMQRACIILTDSGGVQEEAPSLGKPVLVMRDATERPEALAAGTARLVGADADRIVDEVQALLDQPEHYAGMAKAHNPYGDGLASERIAAALAEEVHAHA
jgi:UDP-N-acetylglucosamine 2-epimerase (non-hydrolysing)